MLVHRIEKHLIKQSNQYWKLIDSLSFKSKNLYNYANYIVRQEFINNNKYINYYEMKKMLKTHDPYKDFGSQVSQQTLAMLDRNWKSFFKTIKDWSKNSDKYLGKPNLPKYLDKEKGRYLIILSNIQFKIINEYIYFSWKPLQALNEKYKTHIVGKPMEIRFTPIGKNYSMEIVYEVEVPEIKTQNNKIASIDIGIDNLATVANNVGLQSFIINGKPLKSMNQFYNKEKSRLQSDLKTRHNKNWSNRLQQLTDKRNNKISDYIHKASKKIVDWCIQNNIDTLVVGKNKNWKQESELSKQVNQNFVGIPHDVFIKKLQYKCENVGIQFICNEEGFTSGTSFLDGEEPIKENYDKSRRIVRGLFKSNKGVMINADLNGAYQIMKKVFPNTFVNGTEGVCLHPVRVNI